MPVKDWLNRGYKIDKEINALLLEREKAFNLACKVSAPPSDNERVKASAGNGSENRYIKYAEYSRLIDSRIDRLYQVKNEILTVISAVENNTYRTLLILRYVQFKTWEEIAECMGYSDKWLRTYLHKMALNACEIQFKRRSNGEK